MAPTPTIYMSAPLRNISLLLILPVVALIYFLGAYFSFYGGGYDAPPSVAIPFEEIAQPTSIQPVFADTPQIRRGTLLVDGGHRNDFSKGEASVLLAKVAARGHDIEFLGEEGLFGSFRRLEDLERLNLLEENLRKAHSMLVILPDEPFSREEVDLVERFVDKGGKLLMIGDPTRRNRLNSLAERFGIAFQPDYLYNVVDYDLNFQNVFINNFHPDEITRGLSQIALYTAGSVKSSGPALAYTDANTHSSIVQRVEPLFPMVKSRNGRVLAIGDFTFIIPPQNAILDNDLLISNLADYLTTSERTFDLVDFPNFFQGDVDILLGRSSLFDQGTAAKSLFSALGIDSKIAGVEDVTKDTVYLGLFRDASGVAQYLEVAGIRVENSLSTPFTPAIDLEGTSILLLHQGADRRVLVVLGDSEAAITAMVDRLGSGDYREGLVGDFAGVYRTP